MSLHAVSEFNIKQKIPDMNYYFISGGLPSNYGGLTKSLLLRSKLFGEECNRKTFFLTFRFDLELASKKQDLYKNGKIDEKYTSVINLYDDFLSVKTNGKRSYEEKLGLEQIKKQVGMGKFAKTVSRLFGKRNSEISVTYYADGKTIRYVDYWNDKSQLKKREEYTKNGGLALVTHYDEQLNKMFLQEYVNNKNQVYLDKHYVWNSEEKDIQFSHFTWYSLEGEKKVKDESELRQFWIDYLQNENDVPKLFLVDSRPQDKHVFKVKKSPSAYYGAIIHNKHYGNHKYQIKGRYKEVFSQMYNLDAIFFITEEQIDDFRLISGDQETFFFTPHTIDKPLNPNVLNVPSEKYKAVIISRLASMKNLTHAVKAFSLVVKEIPEAKLDIFGSGEDFEKIKKEIEEHKLQNNVFLKGYTNNPDLEFQKAWLTISTSHFEGFGLSNMEALSNGCPVVTYDYDYGARSLVTDGVNGYVIEQYNIEKLAEGIIALMRDEKTHQEFSEQAFKMAEKYSRSNYIGNWGYALNRMIEVREEKAMLFKKIGKKELPISSYTKDQDKVELELDPHTQEDLVKQISLVGLDRKNKAEIINIPLLNDSHFRIDLKKDINIEKIAANKTQVIDFYIRFIGTNHIKIMRRVSSEEIKFDRNHVMTDLGYCIEPYTTVKGNFSWKLTELKEG
ncbi:alpha-glucosyltransferase N-terminal domain-containing protein [Bacillus halotolerans]|uniref:Glycosyltransferase n=1 Tax=Bacillus halotolerans TaxID=260554 RepID=A0ABY7HZ28_9BACI|nr:alpha-glucosyltransferase N-terminal domain-containing protein [Bacillus halotolerans]MBV5121989.1 glycosyltransferase [Bacillus halotolerans]MCC2115107.1 glycosyltransferase [Bacillus halotolerans]MDG0764732.1 glycosyltransferase [Bacillus halotolerans]MDG3072628.1 alpha-glucosyltransferase N-terminal domain-containing protein [Bacillus halotolerans]WAT20928.1 glycosyltransferase [Bacillus halotolerans]